MKWNVLALAVLIVILSACVSGGKSTVSLYDPVISPNGNEVMFTFRYGTSPYMIAVVSTDPNEKPIKFLELPLNMSWSEPQYSSDMEYIALQSGCSPNTKGNVCFDNAKGFHVWRATIDGSGLERITQDRRKVGYGQPAFGETSDELFYTSGILVAEDERYSPSLILSNIQGNEQVVFPQKSERGMWAKDRGWFMLSLPQHMKKEHFLFRSFISEDHRFHSDIKMDLNPDSPKWATLEYNQGSIQLKHKENSNILATNGDSNTFVLSKTVRNDNGGLTSQDVYLTESGKEYFVFSFQGQLTDLSMSNGLTKYAFKGQSPAGYEYIGPLKKDNWSIWVYDKDTGKITDLQVKERLIQAYSYKSKAGMPQACVDGETAYNQGKFEKAAGLFGQCIDSTTLVDLKKPSNYNNLGNSYLKLGKYQQAGEAYKKALYLMPNSSNYHFNLGIVHRKLGEHQLAVEDNSKVIAIDPKYSLAYLNRGRSFEKLAQYESALKDYEEFLRLDPAHYSYNNLAWLLATCKDVDLRDGLRAVELAQKSLILLPMNHATLDTLAAAYAQTGRSATAVAIENKAITLAREHGKDTKEYERCLKLYSNGEAYREAP